MAKVVDCTERDDTGKHTKPTSGTVVKAKWKLSSRIKKETLLKSDVVKSKNNKGRSLRTQSTTSTRRNLTVSDSDEVLPLTYNSVIAPHPSKDEDGCCHVKELQHKLIKLEESVASMESELTSMKTLVFNEFQELKRTFLQGRTDTTNQFQALLEAIIQSHGTALETQKLMKTSTRVAREERSHEEQRTLLANDSSKRIQPMYGKIENGLVTCHKNGRKIFAIDQESYRQMFDDSKTGTSFLRKLLKVTFTEEELSGSNFSGGMVTSATGMTVKKCLDRDRVLALLGQVELEFPNSTKFGNFTKMREAINEECRRVVRQIRQDQAL